MVAWNAEAFVLSRRVQGCVVAEDVEWLMGSVGIYLLSYYLANKRSLHVRSQGLEISRLIGEKEKLNYPPLPL